MGYRSDIKFVLDFPSVEKRDAFVNMVRVRGDEHEVKMLDEMTINEGERHILGSFDNWKWYDSFPEVQAVESLLEEAASDEENNDTSNYPNNYDPKPIWHGSYLFLRIGENWDDNEERYGGADVPWGTVLFNRSVDFDI